MSAVERSFPYVKQTMNLEEELRIAMKRMSSARFENVLHPIFQVILPLSFLNQETVPTNTLS
jgi:hypothetical protein